MFTKKFQDRFWKSTPYEIIEEKEGVIFAKKILTNTLRMASKEGQDIMGKHDYAFVQIIDGRVVTAFKKEEILLVED